MRMPQTEDDEALTRWSVHVELGRCTATEPDLVAAEAIGLDAAVDGHASGRNTLTAAPDRTGASVSLRQGIALSKPMRDWIVAEHVHGRAVPHDVHLTMRDDHGRVVSRWCLRHAGVARLESADLERHVGAADGDEPVDLTIDELVLTCERIDLEPIA